MAAREQVDDRVSWPISKVLGVHPLLCFSVWPKQGVPSPGFRVKCYCDVLIERLCETLLPENLGNHCREWLAGKTESEIKLLIQENSKPQDPIVYTNALVTKDQSGWGFTVKQGATTIHEDSGIITHPLHRIASRGDNRTTHAIILSDSVSLLQKVKSGMGSPDWNVLMVDIHLSKLLWTCRSEGKRPNK